MSWLCTLCNRIFSHFISVVTPATSPSPTLQRRHHPTACCRQPASTQPPINLLALPDDLLLEIVRHATHCHHDNPSHPPQHVVEQRSYAAASALTSVCQKTAALFYNSLDNVCLASSSVTDRDVDSLARRAGPSLKRLVLRGSLSISNDALRTLAKHSGELRSIDLSFLPAINSEGLAPLCVAAAPRLRHLLLRKCTSVDDNVLVAIAPCRVLHTLDVSYCPLVTDNGMRYLLACAGHSLQLFAMAYNNKLSDATFEAVGAHCKSLVQFCARGLPFISDIGFLKLCAGVGATVEGIDVTNCHSLTRDASLRALSTYCHHVYMHIMPKYSSRSLKQIIISTLRQNIFIVHGSDPITGKDTVHTVLIDNGDIVSASLLSSGTTDLSLLGIVLCKSYGSSLNDETKQMLENDYGIPKSALTD